MSKPTGEEIALNAQQFKLVVLAQHMTLMTIFEPSLPLLRALQVSTGVGPHEDVPLVLGPDSPGSAALQFSTRDVLTLASRLRGEPVREAMSMSMRTAAITLGEMIREGGHSAPDVPLLAFARHFRNACAHGDRWNFAEGQPKTPAICRHLTLTPDHHGRRATWETVSPLLFVLYLDDLSNHFVPGSVPAPQPFFASASDGGASATAADDRHHTKSQTP